MLLMRHAESLEDIDDTIYELALDHTICLTVDGRARANEVATEILPRVGVSRRLSILHTPARRAEETAEVIAARIRSTRDGEVDVRCEADARLAKQDWGSVTVANRVQQLRRRYEAGAMNYKFPDGESGWDVARRIRSLTDELAGWPAPLANATVLITHGFSVRIALMILLNLTEAQFEQYANPPNCFIADVRAHDAAMTLVGEGPPLYAPGPWHIPRVR